MGILTTIVVNGLSSLQKAAGIDDYMIKHGMTQCSLQAIDLHDKGNLLISIPELSQRHHPKFTDEDKTISGKMSLMLT